MKVFQLIRFLALVISSGWAAKLPLGIPGAPAPSQKVALKFPGSAEPSGLYQTPAESLETHPVDSTKIESLGEITETSVKTSSIVETPVESVQGPENPPALESSSDVVQIPVEPSGIYGAPSESLPGSAHISTDSDVQDQATSIFSDSTIEHKTEGELVSISVVPSVPVETPSELVPLSTEFGTLDQGVQGAVVPSSLGEAPSKIEGPTTHHEASVQTISSSTLPSDILETPLQPHVEHDIPLDVATGTAEHSSPNGFPSKVESSDQHSASKETTLDVIPVETEAGSIEHSSSDGFPSKVESSDQHSASKETTLDVIPVETETGSIEHSSPDEIPSKVESSDQHSASKETTLDAIPVEKDTVSVESSSQFETPIKVESSDQSSILHEASSGALSDDAGSSTGLEIHGEELPSSVQPSSESNAFSGSSEHLTLHETPEVSVASPSVPAGLYEAPLSPSAPLDKPSTLQEIPKKPIIFPDTFQTSVQPVPVLAEPSTLQETPQPLAQVPAGLYEAPRKTGKP